MKTRNQTALPKIPGDAPPEPYKAMIQRYLSYLYQDGAATLTIKAYGWHLHKLGIWLVEQGATDPNDISPDVIIAWGERLRSKYAAQTHKQSVVATKAFLRFSAEFGYCHDDIVVLAQKLLSTPKTKITLQRTLSKRDVEKLMNTCQENTDGRGIRDAAMIALLLDSGLRAGELCSAKLRDVNFSNRRVVVIGKGGQKETVYYSRKCNEFLSKWVDVRSDISNVACENLFVSIGGTTRGKPLTPRGLRSILKQIGANAGVADLHPHAFRRSFATLRIKDGQSTRGVQRLGRWKNLANLERYTHALMVDDEYAQKEANDYSPLGC